MTARALLEELAAIGADPAGGWSRPAWGAAEQAAHDWFAATARKMGLSVRQDAFGNSIARRDGRADLPAIATGSHLDTVRGGGLYDGALGVVLGLAAAGRLPQGLRPLEVIAFRDEEGRFGPFTGSRAMTGDLAPDALDRLRDADGVALRDAMADCGLAPATPQAAARDLSELAAWVEVHIEQGPVLEAAGIPLGIVTAIAGQERLTIRFTGLAGHAGTVPMDRRQDAFQAAAQFALAFDSLIRDAGGDARGTIGIVRVDPNQGNVIPREVRLSLEIRDSDAARLARLAAQTEALAQASATDRKVSAQIRRAYAAPPVPMAAHLMATLDQAAAGRAMRLLSGANHDAGILGQHIPAAMLFVPSRGGISHTPDEHTDPAPIDAAADVLTAALARLIESPTP